MIEIIFTSRPISWKPISWVNAITRMKTNSPFDHVALKCRGYVHESTSGKGVHKIKYEDWLMGREGTYLFIYQVPNDLINFGIFENLKGRGYDYKANILYLFGRKKALKKKANDKLFCSELIAHMMRLENPYEYTPDDIEYKLREYESYIINL